MSSSNGSNDLPLAIDFPRLPLISDFSNIDGIGDAPVKRIFTEGDLESWLDSSAYRNIETFVLRLIAAVDGKKVEDTCIISPITRKLTQFLETLLGWVDETPLDPSPQRFGNKAFRDWIAKLQESEPAFQRDLIDGAHHAILPELSYHFMTSFGSGARLDYGTGHELSFLSYLLTLRLVGLFGEEDEQAIVTKVFVAYLGVVRRLQKRFRLEPAGSKGVWGLDDHQHLVYLFGASQLRSHPLLRPASILSLKSISPYGPSYLFLSSIVHVNDLKSGPFAEHSPMLHNIASTVPNWGKVIQGLMKMYREEVLKKVPVIQHFRFGNILSWTHYRTGKPLPSTLDTLIGEDTLNAQRKVPQTEFSRITDQGTIAPWATSNQSGVRSSSISSNFPDGRSEHMKAQPLRLPSRFGYERTATFGKARPPSACLPEPVPFTPPTLFPRSSTPAQVFSAASSSGQGSRTSGGLTKSVADEGGAAALDSPFGVLPSVSRNL